MSGDSSIFESAATLLRAHPRQFDEHRYVYPVLSRRAGGISIGVNLNVDQICNFHCIYCQVQRIEGKRGQSPFAGTARRRAPTRSVGRRTNGDCPLFPVDLARLAEELDRTVELAASGRIFQETRFRATPAPLRRLNDIALSGDAEPTSSPQFAEAVAVCAEVRRRRQLDDVKLVLITNASLLDREVVERGLKILDANNGEIWAKLDAGTEDYYRQVARSTVQWPRILDNLRRAAIERPIVVQSLFMRIHGEPPPAAELEAYCDRLHEIVAVGGRIKLVQVHTVARSPAEPWVAPLPPAEVDALAELVRRRTGLSVAAFYGH
jgi:wyosine [tRNA(Phe)-imidazoG37] synthetase (radical SAM superfamily)